MILLNGMIEALSMNSKHLSQAKYKLIPIPAKSPWQDTVTILSYHDLLKLNYFHFLRFMLQMFKISVIIIRIFPNNHSCEVVREFVHYRQKKEGT
jgi:hypothetical protein